MWFSYQGKNFAGKKKERVQIRNRSKLVLLILLGPGSAGSGVSTLSLLGYEIGGRGGLQ